MGDNDRELGEISAKLDIMAKSIDKLTTMLDTMQLQGCVIGRENRDAINQQLTRISDLEASMKKVIYAGITVLVGGQAGIEVIKQILMP